MSGTNMTNNKELFEFPDSGFVKLDLSPSEIEQLSLAPIHSDSGESCSSNPALSARFASTVAVPISIGVLQIFLSCLTKLPSFLYLPLLFLVGHFLREWYRIHGGSLSRNPKATMNYRTLLDINKSYIPCYELGWLLGEGYKPFVYGCCPPLDGDDRTCDEPEARSPTNSTARKNM